MLTGLAALARELSGFGLTWMVQSSVLLTLGIVAGRLLRRSGPAVQSGVYRTTLAAVLVCPFASAALGIAGFDGFSLRLPRTGTQAPPDSCREVRACRRQRRTTPWAIQSRRFLFRVPERTR